MSYPPADDPQQPGQPQPPSGVPYPFADAPPHPPVKSAMRRRLPWILAGAAVLGVLCCGGTVTAVVVAGQRKPDHSAQKAASTPPPTAETVATTDPTTDPTTEPATDTPTTVPPKPAPATYTKLSSRQWKKIAKDPDAHIGDHIVVYGTVTQFDAATGDDTFRANVGAANMSESYEYDTNTILTGDTSDLSDLVEDDEFRADVTVLGSYSYETQVGGETTVPSLRVDKIKVL